MWPVYRFSGFKRSFAGEPLILSVGGTLTQVFGPMEYITNI